MEIVTTLYSGVKFRIYANNLSQMTKGIGLINSRRSVWYWIEFNIGFRIW